MMMGSLLSRALVMVFGYAYPAYQCVKSVEKNKPEIEQLLFWCHYWIVVAMLTISERVCDTFICWLPFYYEAKLALFMYLWYPKTKGTNHIYNSFIKPYVAKYETEIDKNILEMRDKAGEIANLYWENVLTLGQTCLVKFLTFVSTLSASTEDISIGQVPKDKGK